MGLFKKISVLVVLVAVLVGIIIVKYPVPNDLKHHWLARGVTIVETGSRLVADVGEKLGFGPKCIIFKSIIDRLSILQSKNDSDVKIFSAKFDGIPVLVFDPVGREKDSAALIYYHGGGWTLLNVHSYQNPVQSMAKATKYLIISVDYGLAPEFIFPTPLNDCLKATKYLLQNAADYGVNAKRVAIGGDSAGGNLAAAVALKLKNEDFKLQPKAKVLIYPVLQLIDFKLPSYQGDTKMGLSAADMAFYTSMYASGSSDETREKAILANQHVSLALRKLHANKISHSLLPKKNFPTGYKPETELKVNAAVAKDLDPIVSNPLFSPLLADDLSGLPSTLIITCQYDVVRDDGYLYAKRLHDAKVKVRHINYDGAWHGAFWYQTSFPFVEDIRAFLKSVL